MRFYASVAYDGSHFCGFQSQPDGRAVQDQLEAVFAGFFGKPLRIAAVSRTDSGVHAFDQRIEWEADTPVPPQRFPVIFNHRLKHIRLHWADFAPENFSARKPCRKRYCYKVRFGRVQPFFESYYWCRLEKLANIDRLQEIMSLFLGEHDFRHFCKIDKSRQITDFRRIIEQVSVTEESESEWNLRFTGTGFLWKMVRYLVAAGFYCLEGKLPFSTIGELLKGGSFSDAGIIAMTPAPAQGLYLEEVCLV